ncbi:MAG: hypothetical protein HYX68_05845 [Planctomycetes bacterium]|jgi:hypothetical protein|nr:hypothetical protein [Planctomycetota bacterium]
MEHRTIRAIEIVVGYFAMPVDQADSLNAITPFCFVNWQSHRLPPPTDRVIAFQHFVI